MNEMWTALERYQPFADQHGFGVEWRRMTTERTAEAAVAASDAAWATAWAASAAFAAVASSAAASAAFAAADAAFAAADAAEAIKYINKAIALEETK